MNELSRKLIASQNECTLAWTTRDGRPAATIVSYVELDGELWMTALAGSPRVRALARDPRATIVVTGKGTALGQGRCVSLQGHCRIEENAEARTTFFQAFARAVLPNSEKGAAAMAKGMNTPPNLAIVFHTTKSIPYDSADMLAQANSI